MRLHKIFIGLIECAGYFQRLYNALRGLGIDVEYHGIYDTAMYYEAANPSTAGILERVLHRMMKKKTRRNADVFAILRKIAIKSLLFLFFLRCLLRFDTFIFTVGASFFSGRELPLLRLFKKKIIFIYLGSEARPPYLNGIFTSPPHWRGYRHLRNYSQAIARRVRWQERFSFAIISHPEASQYLTRPFFDYYTIGYPKPLSIAPPAPSCSGPIRVVHAPSVPHIKGTPIIRELVKKYAAIRPIEYIELIGYRNEQVLEKLQTCDLVFDELYSDGPLGALGAEAASFGKPTLVSGYAYESNMNTRCGARVWPVAEYCHPKNLEEKFANLIENESYRRNLGAAARRFLEMEWSPNLVALRILQVLQGSAPPQWEVDPRDIRYFHGYGMDEARLRTVLHELISRYGEGCLGIAHNRQICSDMCTFANVKARYVR